MIAFEDLEPGTTIDLGKVVVDHEEMLEFARRFDPQPLHLDEEAAARSVLGGLCASGWFTMSLFMRSYVDNLLVHTTSQGSPGGSEIAWPAPVFPGDVLHCAIEVLSARRSRSRLELGIVEVRGTAHRGDQCVLRFTFTALFGTREAPEPAEPPDPAEPGA